MRNCIRCQREMIENANVNVVGGVYGIELKYGNFFRKNIGKITCAVCPECGYVENYIIDTKKLKKIEMKLEKKKDKKLKKESNM